MCGIVGLAGRDGVGEPPFDLMRDSLQHRGPDSAGCWSSPDGKVWLGHRRLAIIDLSEAGHQPMTYDDGRFAITFNGEIYNYQTLRDELRAKGAEFRSNSDTEVILAGYREWGNECISRLSGMFAFAIYDRRAGVVTLARDRAGEKPLFYRHSNGRLAFASELKALLADRDVPRRLNLSALNQYLAYGYVARDACILDGFSKLLPGEALEYRVDSDALRRWSWWSLPAPEARRDRDLQDIAREAEDILQDSVRMQLRADVPVGIMLSGGLDSSLVTAMAARVTPNGVRTFTVSFPGHERFDERPYARAVAEHFGTDHAELMAEPSSIELLPRLVEQFDEPIADSSMLPTFLVSREIRRHATVALGGDGGDELFGGYVYYSSLARRAALARFFPAALRRLIASAGLRVVPIGARGRTALRGIGSPDPGGLPFVNMYFDQSARERLVPALASIAEGLDRPEANKRRLGSEQGSVVDRATRADFLSYLPDDALVKVDRASMLTSLEVRAPWLDPRMIDLAFRATSSDLKVDRNGRKYIPKAMARRLLPGSLDVDRKQGFTIPLDAWLRGDARAIFVDALMGTSDPLFERKEVERIIALQRRGVVNAQRLFALAIMELWRERYAVS